MSSRENQARPNPQSRIHPLAFTNGVPASSHHPQRPPSTNHASTLNQPWSTTSLPNNTQYTPSSYNAPQSSVYSNSNHVHFPTHVQHGAGPASNSSYNIEPNPQQNYILRDTQIQAAIGINVTASAHIAQPAGSRPTHSYPVLAAHSTDSVTVSQPSDVTLNSSGLSKLVCDGSGTKKPKPRDFRQRLYNALADESLSQIIKWHFVYGKGMGFFYFVAHEQLVFEYVSTTDQVIERDSFHRNLRNYGFKKLPKEIWTDQGSSCWYHPSGNFRQGNEAAYKSLKKPPAEETGSSSQSSVPTSDMIAPSGSGEPGQSHYPHNDGELQKKIEALEEGRRQDQKQIEDLRRMVQDLQAQIQDLKAKVGSHQDTTPQGWPNSPGLNNSNKRIRSESSGSRRGVTAALVERKTGPGSTLNPASSRKRPIHSHQAGTGMAIVPLPSSSTSSPLPPPHGAQDLSRTQFRDYNIQPPTESDQPLAQPIYDITFGEVGSNDNSEWAVVHGDPSQHRIHPIPGTNAHSVRHQSVFQSRHQPWAPVSPSELEANQHCDRFFEQYIIMPGDSSPSQTPTTSTQVKTSTSTSGAKRKHGVVYAKHPPHPTKQP